MRLCAPWLMLVLAAASVCAAASGTGTLGRRDVRSWLRDRPLFYVAAAAGPRGGRIAGVARTFVVLNVAAVVGLARHLTGRQRVTW